MVSTLKWRKEGFICVWPTDGEMENPLQPKLNNCQVQQDRKEIAWWVRSIDEDWLATSDGDEEEKNMTMSLSVMRSPI